MKEIKHKKTGKVFAKGITTINAAEENKFNLGGAYLSGADLSGSILEFVNFPSIRLISQLYLYISSKKLKLELMRRDAWGHPYPNLFDDWAKGSDCPYKNEERSWFFKESRELWKPIKQICRTWNDASVRR